MAEHNDRKADVSISMEEELFRQLSSLCETHSVTMEELLTRFAMWCIENKKEVEEFFSSTS